MKYMRNVIPRKAKDKMTFHEHIVEVVTLTKMYACAKGGYIYVEKKKKETLTRSMKPNHKRS